MSSLVATVGIVAGWILIGVGEREAATAGPNPTRGSDSLEGDRDSNELSLDRTVAPSLKADESIELVPIESILAQYWGSQWGEIRQRLVDIGYDLEQAIDPSTIAAWEDVEEEFRAEMLTQTGSSGLDRVLGARTDDAYLAKRWLEATGRQPNAAERSAIRDVAERYRESFRRAAETCVARELECREQLWSIGRYSRAPIHDFGPPEGQDDHPIYFVNGSVVRHGWSFSYALRPEDHAGWSAALEEYAWLVDQYNQELIALMR